MEIYRIGILASKLKERYKGYDNPTGIYLNLKNDMFVSPLLKDGRLSGLDLFYLIFMIYLLNQGKSGDSILNLLQNFTFGFKVSVILESDPDVECDSCSGTGELECDSCYGAGTRECDECDGTGEKSCDTCDGEGRVDCDTCDGTGEDEEGGSCSECDGDGYVNCTECRGRGSENCDWCGGDGDLNCGNCDGTGNEECTECDGKGEVEQTGYNKVDVHSFLSISTKLKDVLLDFEERKISQELFEQIENDKLTINLSVIDDIVDDFYGDYEDDDIIMDYIDETPNIFFSSGNILKFN